MTTSLRKRVYGLIRGITPGQGNSDEHYGNNKARGSSAPSSPEWPIPDSSNTVSAAGGGQQQSFIHHYLNGFVCF